MYKKSYVDFRKIDSKNTVNDQTTICQGRILHIVLL